MNSVAKPSQAKQNVINKPNPSILSTQKSTSSRRTPSLTSNSSSSSSFRSSSLEEEECSFPSSPSTSPRSVSSGRIPFSWETIPGIPKEQQIVKKVDPSSRNYDSLPLPPALSNAPTTTKFNVKKHHITRRDPFFTALVECSKGGDAENDHKDLFSMGNIWKPAKNLSTRFGFVNMSCKSSSTVAESLVLLPRGPRRISYDIIKKRAG